MEWSRFVRHVGQTEALAKPKMTDSTVAHKYATVRGFASDLHARNKKMAASTSFVPVAALRTSCLARSANGYVSSVCRLNRVGMLRTPKFMLEGVEACATCHVEHEVLEAEIGAGGIELHFAA
jgi:hypothetical protein